MPVAKYRSRRSAKRFKANVPKKKTGGSVGSVASVAVKHDVHMSAHHPEDLIQAVQHQPEIAHVAHELLQQHATVAKNVTHRFRRWNPRRMERSIDLHAMAKSIFKRHKFKHMPKLGGGIEQLENVAKIANKMGNPIKEAEATKSSYDKVDFNDTSARGVLRSGISAYAGNFHAASTHMKTAALIPGAQAIEPAAQAFSAVGYGLDKFRSVL